MVEKMRAIASSIRGEAHSAWKGAAVSYSGIHKWVNRNFGRPDTCEHCATGGLSGRNINWANISGEYKRDRNDWLRLCRSCHTKYDKAL